jgi:UDP-GlcNAc:undecaprenyl-phosphate GlcNAc-1-phosphate transferase
MNLVRFLIPVLAAVLTSYFLSPLVAMIALRIGAVDRPGPRKIHQSPVTRLGGLAVLAGILSASIAMIWLPDFGNSRLPRELWLGVGLGLIPIVVVSLADDIRGLRAHTKFIAHVVGAVVAVSFGISLGEEVHFFGVTMSIGVLALPISVLWIVGVTNAFNIVDGLDGLAAGLGLISSISLAATFMLVGLPGMAAAAVVIAGSLVGFLPYNIFPARMFLGDTGATAVGFCLAALALRSGSTVSAGFAVLIPVFALGLPIAETLISVVRRILKRFEEKSGGGVFNADRNHIHHRLLALGIDHRRAVFILYGAGLLLASGALMSMFMTARDAALVALALLLGACTGVAKLGYDEFAVIRNGVVLRLYEAPVVKRSMFVVFVDLLLVALGVYCAVALKTDDWWLATFDATTFSMIAVLAPITVVVFSFTNVYRSSWRIADAHDFLRMSGGVLLASTIGMAAHAFLTVENTVSSVALFSIYGLVSLALVTLSRGSFQILVAMRRRGSTSGAEALIYGAGRRGAAAFQELTSNPNSRLRPVAFIDDDPDKAGKLVSGVPVVGSLSTMHGALRHFAPRAVIVSSAKISGQRLAEARALCQRQGLTFLKMQINFDGVDAAEAQPLAASAATSASGSGRFEPSWRTMHAATTASPYLLSNGAPDKSAAVAELRAIHVQPGSERKSRTKAMFRCQRCGAFTLYRSHTRTVLERARKKLSNKRVYRCETCGWHTWNDSSEIMELSVGQPPANMPPSELEPMLESIDGLLYKNRSSPAPRMLSPAGLSSNMLISHSPNRP